MNAEILVPRKQNSTNNKFRFTLRNKSDGEPLSNLVFNSDSLSITVTRDNSNSSYGFYDAEDGGIETIATPGTYVAPTSGKCRFKWVSGPEGLHELQLSDSLFLASNLVGAKELRICIAGAENLEQKELVVPIGYDSVDLTNSINTASNDLTALIQQDSSLVYVISTVQSQTVFDAALDAISGSGFVGRLVLIKSNQDELFGSCIRQIVSTVRDEETEIISFTINSACDFTVADGDSIQILPQASQLTGVSLAAFNAFFASNTGNKSITDFTAVKNVSLS